MWSVKALFLVFSLSFYILPYLSLVQGDASCLNEGYRNSERKLYLASMNQICNFHSLCSNNYIVKSLCVICELWSPINTIAALLNPLMPGRERRWPSEWLHVSFA